MAHLILYDGVCGLCQGVVQFVLRRDDGGAFCFAALQSNVAHTTLAGLGVPEVTMDTFYVVVDHGTPAARLLDRSDGALFVMGQLGGIWRMTAPLRLLPKVLRDVVYDFVRRHRYAWFGQTDACMVPSPAARARFLDAQAP